MIRIAASSSKIKSRDFQLNRLVIATQIKMHGQALGNLMRTIIRSDADGTSKI